ncbi:MAG: glycosyltransferase family 2 protein [Hyphomicrobiales bacterium]
MTWLLIAATLVLAIPAVVLFVEVMAALIGGRRLLDQPADRNGRRPSVCVLMPAHDEAMGIRSTIEDVRRQLGPDDRLLVVADNCRDDTATIARAAGAEVLERFDRERRGKGYALAFGIDGLRPSPPQVVLVVDADCHLGAGMLDLTARRAFALQRPVQAYYEMRLTPGSPPGQLVSGFAWLVKNLVRPLGLAVLGLPCQLMGTGMAFPWPVIAQANLATGHVVEDLKLGLELAARRTGAVFEPRACVWSRFAGTSEGIVSQRNRWEMGSTAILLAEAPRAFARSIAALDPHSAGLSLDALVPPLVLYLALLIVAFALALLAVLPTGSLLPAVILLVALALVGMSLIISWLAYGRSTLPPGSARDVLAYILQKTRIYRRPAGWVRTDRNDH